MASGIPFGNRLGNRKPRRSRRYRPLPALMVIGVLGLVAMVVWVRVIIASSDIDAAVRCSPPPTPPAGTTFTPLSHTALDDAVPLPPDKVAVKVLNAGQMRGQAAMTTESLRELGFTQVAPPENDPAYPKGDAQCRGQIRFGEHGIGAARTLSLVAPCAELVQDNRADASVDFAIGNGFTQLLPTQQARQVLAQLQEWSTQNPGNGDDGSAKSGPVIDPSLLAAARDVGC